MAQTPEDAPRRHLADTWKPVPVRCFLCNKVLGPYVKEAADFLRAHLRNRTDAGDTVALRGYFEAAGLGRECCRAFVLSYLPPDARAAVKIVGRPRVT